MMGCIPEFVALGFELGFTEGLVAGRGVVVATPVSLAPAESVSAGTMEIVTAESAIAMCIVRRDRISIFESLL